MFGANIVNLGKSHQALGSSGVGRTGLQYQFETPVKAEDQSRIRRMADRDRSQQRLNKRSSLRDTLTGQILNQTGEAGAEYLFVFNDQGLLTLFAFYRKDLLNLRI